MIPHITTTLVGAVVLLELAWLGHGEAAIFEHGGLAGNTTEASTALVWLPRSADDMEGRGMMHEEDHHAMEKPKSKPWLGYYDFLITEGSYKFWVVFELFTVGLLVYSAFAALYYAKYTITDYDDYADYYFKRSTRSAESDTFLGLPVQTYSLIFKAIESYSRKYS